MFKYFLAFRAVYENRNFSAAARQIFTSQSSVSQQIQKLEKILGNKLFIRNSRSEVIPTETADQLYQKGVSLYEKQQALQKQLTQKQAQQIECQIGISHTIADILAPQLLEHLIENTNSKILVQISNSTNIAKKIANHQLTFGLIEKPIITPNIERKAFYTDQLVHAGNFHSSIWLEREDGSGVYYYTEEFFKQNNLAPEKLITINNNDLIVRCLKMGIGQSIISKNVVPKDVHFENLDHHFERPFFFLSRQSYPFPELIELKKGILQFLKSFSE